MRLRRLGRLWLPLLSLELRLRGGLRLSSLRGYLLDCKRLLGGLTQQLLSLSLGCRSLRRIRGLAEGVKASDRRILLLFFLPLSFKLGFLSASQLSLLLLLYRSKSPLFARVIVITPCHTLLEYRPLLVLLGGNLGPETHRLTNDVPRVRHGGLLERPALLFMLCTEAEREVDLGRSHEDAAIPAAVRCIECKLGQLRIRHAIFDEQADLDRL